MTHLLFWRKLHWRDYAGLRIAIGFYIRHGEEKPHLGHFGQTMSAIKQIGAGFRILPGSRASSALSRAYLTPRARTGWTLQTRATQRAWESTVAKDDVKDGHIELAPNESILWFDSRCS